MRESTREFLADVKAKLHDDRVSEVDMQKALAPHKTFDQWEAERKEKEAQEKAKLERYRHNQYTPEERKKSEEALREMLKPISEQIKHNQVREAAFWDNFNKRQSNQEGREQIERLLEIAQERNDYINARIKDAEAQGNEFLLEQYTQEKADNDKNLELYRGKYEEYKKAAEG